MHANPQTISWFSPGTKVPLPLKTHRHEITEILLKVALNTINQPKPIKPSLLILKTAFEANIQPLTIHKNSSRNEI